MNKIYKLRYTVNTSSNVVVHEIINICASSQSEAINSIIRAQQYDGLISVELLEIINFVTID